VGEVRHAAESISSPELMAKVPVNGRVLEWARQTRGLKLAPAAELLNISSAELQAYESGEKQPLIGFLREMSRRYRINFTSLLMPEPLPPVKRPTDHRSRFSRRPLSIDTLVAIEEVSDALETFADIASEMPRIIPKLRIGRAKLEENPAKVAARERVRFGVSFAQQRSWKGAAQARVRWREKMEERGVFTYMHKLPELSGFSILHDEEFAAICVNDLEPTDGAKIFTLLHEYCHLLLRNAGISDQSDRSKVERYCNRFAAAFLIPKANLLEAVSEVVPDRDAASPYDFSDSHVKRLSGIFRVSNRAMALRLERTGLAPAGFYGKRTGAWDIPKVVEPKPQSNNKKSKPSAINIAVKRIGKLHAHTVLEAVRLNAINSFDASELIGLQPSTFPKVEAQLLK